MSLADVPVYVICLARSARASVTLTELSAQGMNPLRIDAVDSQDLLDPDKLQLLQAEFPRLRDIDKSKVMGSAAGDVSARNASLACCLSHLRCLSKIKQQAHPYALVLEDDAQLHPQTRLYLAQLLRHCAQWDVLRLHYSEKPMAFGVSVASIAEQTEPATVLNIYQYLGGHNGAVALLYSQSGIDKVLAMHDHLNSDFRYCFDSIFSKWYWADLRYCYLKPMLAWQNQCFDSTIYSGVSNSQYEKNISGWFSVRGRLSRMYKRIIRVYLRAPQLLLRDGYRLWLMVSAGLRLYLNYRRNWRS